MVQNKPEPTKGKAIEVTSDMSADDLSAAIAAQAEQLEKREPASKKASNEPVETTDEPPAADDDSVSPTLASLSTPESQTSETPGDSRIKIQVHKKGGMIQPPGSTPIESEPATKESPKDEPDTVTVTTRRKTVLPTSAEPAEAVSPKIDKPQESSAVGAEAIKSPSQHAEDQGSADKDTDDKKPDEKSSLTSPTLSELAPKSSTEVSEPDDDISKLASQVGVKKGEQQNPKVFDTKEYNLPIHHSSRGISVKVLIALVGIAGIVGASYLIATNIGLLGFVGTL